MFVVARFDGVEDFVGFFDQKFTEGGMGLLGVPGAAAGAAEAELGGRSSRANQRPACLSPRSFAGCAAWRAAFGESADFDARRFADFFLVGLLGQRVPRNEVMNLPLCGACAKAQNNTGKTASASCGAGTGGRPAAEALWRVVELSFGKAVASHRTPIGAVHFS